MKKYPKIKSVKPLPDYRLLVKFDNDITKVYDCTEILNEPPFALLKNLAFFRAVRVDSGGYGVSWNDELDLSEAELWLQGEVAENDVLNEMAINEPANA